ncbi:MAG TPA: nucleoside-diphosphate kinase [Candidatus Paceibacterota bacterium]
MRACCIIKPKATGRRDEIVAALKNEGVSIIREKRITYTKALVHALYDHMDQSARDAIAARLCGMDGIALLLEVASIDRLLEVVGDDSDPRRCRPHTLRARFASGASEERMGDAPWWENAVHRPINEREALRDLSLLFPS